jgi:hypothetical protein
MSGIQPEPDVSEKHSVFQIPKSSKEPTERPASFYRFVALFTLWS